MSPEMNLQEYMLQMILVDLVQVREEIESKKAKLPKSVNSFFDLDKQTQADVFISIYNEHWDLNKNKYISKMQKLNLINPDDMCEYVHRMINHAIRIHIINRNDPGIEINKEYESDIRIIIKRIVRN